MQQAFQGFNHLLKYIHSHFPVFYIYMWRQHVHFKKKTLYWNMHEYSKVSMLNNKGEFSPSWKYPVARSKPGHHLFSNNPFIMVKLNTVLE